jgi:bla regulator protein BlaR1
VDAALLAHLWQSTLCAMVAWGVVVALRGYSARLRYLVWLAASLKFLVPFSALTALGLELRSSGAGGLLISEALANAALSIARPLSAPVELSARGVVGEDLKLLLSVLWAAGCAVFLARWFLSWQRARAAVREAEPIRLDVPIDVRVSPDFSEPGVFGVREPVLLLPTGVVTKLSADELAAVISHEMCHVRRRDNLAASLHMLVEAVFWFHPLVWWIGRKLLEERERACDEAVIELGAAPRTYAEGILKACRLSIESRLGIVAGAAGANLRQRIEVICRNQPSRRLGAVGRGGLVTLGIAVLLVPVSVGLATPRPVERDPALHATSIHACSPGMREEPRLLLSDGRLSMRGFDIEAGRPETPGGDPDDDAAARRELVLGVLSAQFRVRLAAWGRQPG